jgi:cytochrome c biogenesis protein CcmG, thiol:disulfide interchange protein DsbE
MIEGKIVFGIHIIRGNIRLCAIMAILLVAASATPAMAGSKTQVSGTAAPSFTLPTQDGTISLESLRGKPVLVDFWASWCIPCQMSFPWMSEMYRAYGDKGLTIIAINLDKNQERADAFLEAASVRFDVAFDPSGKTAEAYKVTAMPSSFLIDKEGKIVHVRVGFDPKKNGEVEALIKQACSQ